MCRKGGIDVYISLSIVIWIKFPEQWEHYARVEKSGAPCFSNAALYATNVSNIHITTCAFLSKKKLVDWVFLWQSTSPSSHSHFTFLVSLFLFEFYPVSLNPLKIFKYFIGCFYNMSIFAKSVSVKNYKKVHEHFVSIKDIYDEFINIYLH